ncbi:MAG TPA: M13 family metallopeptidase [Gemmatimonadaceae bacterium]|nr:M13 family metallopeptidase [Gemmatimonadaceae bacterium]
MRCIARQLAFVSLAFTVTATAGAQGTYRQTVPLDPVNLDRTANACVDFYQFANGGWIKNNPIPAAYSRWGSFNELEEKNQSELTKILERAAADASANRSAANRMLGTYYSSCMDSTAAEQAGAEPLRPRLARIAAITDRSGVQREIAQLHLEGVNVVFNFGATQDARNSTSVIGGARQAGLGLPDRDYYTKTDQASATIRKNYLEHMGKMFQLAGKTPAEAAADAGRVIAFETALARASLTRVERRDPVATYNFRTPAQLASMTPNFSWTRYFTDIGAPGVPAVDVESPKFLAAVDSLMGNAPLADWKAYLSWKVIRGAAPYLSSAFVNEEFSFSRTLSGAKEVLPRVKRCTRGTDAGLQDALGQAYVAEYFTPTAKARALEMVHNLEAVFRERLSTLPWMRETTRKQAIVKLEAFAEKIGYPDTWREYSTLKIQPGPFLNNVVAVNVYENRRDLARIGKPLDRTQWGMTPPTVNAYFNPQLNEIVFPAGILQPPFFSATADDAVNYGGMGSVIGHEMGHGFDDQGAQFDSQGNLKNWWSAEDLEKFKTRTTLIVNQYDAYTVLDTIHVSGKLTVGENAADIGGLSVAYAALQKALAGKPKPLIDGFTPEQRFFLAWAQIWRQNITPQNQMVRINTDPHSPGRWRTNGPLANMPEFAKAFGCKPGDPMVRPEAVRATLW